MPRPPSSNPIVAKLAERNVTMARIRERMAATRTHEPSPARPERAFGPFITIERQHGAGGADLARRVAAALSWSVLDREVVEMVASHLQIDPGMAGLLDSRTAGWVSEALSCLIPDSGINRDRYADELRRAVQLLAIHGNVVLVGHAAHLMLPRGAGLAVRVVASEEDRTARIRARSGLNAAEAHREMATIDRARAQFVSRAFRRDVSDPLLYDLVVNSSSMPLEAIATLVVSAWREKVARADWAGLKAS